MSREGATRRLRPEDRQPEGRLRLPRRRALEGRLRVPRPPGFYGRGAEGWKGGLVAALGAFNRAVYRSAPGRWLRRHLDRSVEFADVEVTISRGGPGLHGLRVAWISDVHAGCFVMEADVCRLFERVAAAEPDLVCLGGDLVEARAEDALLLGKGLSLLRPPLGVFAVPGNHEYYAESDLRLWRHCLEEHGVTVLLNQGQRVSRNGESLWLAGVDDLCHGWPDLDGALAGVRHEEPILLMAHHPDLFREAADVGVDLTLSGHTHGGQITFFGRTFLRHSTLGYWKGWFEQGGAQLYVGRGSGTTGLPLRIHAPAEVPFIRLVTRD